YPKANDNFMADKKRVISQGVNTIRDEFIKPALDRYDSENGTNLLGKYMEADPAFSQLIEHFGAKGTKLGKATQGGAYQPSEYKNFYKVLDNAVKNTDLPVG